MTGKEIVATIPQKCRRGHDNDPVTLCRGCLHSAIDAAIEQVRREERERLRRILFDTVFEVRERTP